MMIALRFGMNTTFTMLCECFRCSGFERAFEQYRSVNDGRCLRCDGTLRDVVTKPVERLAEYYPCDADRRARSIATIAKVLDLVGVKRIKGTDGRFPSAWGFTYWRRGDNEKVFAAALSIAPDDVRVRAWAAFARKVRETMPEKGDAPMRCIKRILATYAGVHEADMALWLGETTDTFVVVAA